MTTEVRASYCFECRSEQPAEAVGEDCAEATQSMRHEDYYGDGSVSQPMGTHMVGYRCLTCGDIEAEPCIHD